MLVGLEWLFSFLGSPIYISSHPTFPSDDLTRASPIICCQRISLAVGALWRLHRSNQTQRDQIDIACRRIFLGCRGVETEDEIESWSNLLARRWGAIRHNWIYGLARRFSPMIGDNPRATATARPFMARERTRKKGSEQERKCLRCHQTFLSEWAGERVCKACKGSSQWRIGLN